MQHSTPKILFPSDFSEFSANAWSTCEAFAKAYEADIVLLYVIEPPTLGIGFEEELAMMSSRTFVNEKIAELGWDKNVNITPLIKVGKPFKKIGEAALEVAPIMMVMGTHGASGFEEWFIGSNASKIIRSSTCPVITVRNPQPDGIFKRILVPLDLTKATREKVTKAIELAEKFKGALHLVSVLASTNKEDEEYLKKQLDGVTTYIQAQGIEVFSELIQSTDYIATAILNYGKEIGADFICIMTQQEKSIQEYFVGSVAEHIVNRSEIPVFSIRPFNLYVAKKQGSIFS
jgi:nucleotide-binding universal stress UspA family protein